MPLADITNPDVIKFLVESYDKTTRLRLKWNRLHADKLKEAATLHRDEKGYFETDVLKESMAGGMATITRDFKVAGYNRRRTPIRDGVHIYGVSEMKKGHSIVDVGLGDPKDDPRLARPDTDLTIDPIMRPIDPKEKKILYDDVPTYGRAVYLKNRTRTMPEKKYYFNECSGWVYGWRLGDSFFKKNAPKCGRVWRLTRDVKSRTGPHPDPAHYKESEPPGVSKCPL
ncbi:uncharacterized protein LOC114357287 [Ostrinia furnacalis]|uniref:uncharacterized protein LOC114357287 n=1 Tax=Ostrinia furnacalis TaxID=93504 RepID=UPI001040A8E6|nr:uncharacterized protein LOC114357287 [Ostrinia furnacalis]